MWRQLDTFWKIANEIIHSENKKEHYKTKVSSPTTHTLPILLHIFLDFLQWLDSYLEENN